MFVKLKYRQKEIIINTHCITKIIPLEHNEGQAVICLIDGSQINVHKTYVQLTQILMECGCEIKEVDMLVVDL